MPVVVIVVIIAMVAAIKPRAGLKVGAAAAVNPNAPVVIAPSLAEDTGRFAALPD